MVYLEIELFSLCWVEFAGRHFPLFFFFKPGERCNCYLSSYLFIFRNTLLHVLQRHRYDTDELEVSSTNRAVQTVEFDPPTLHLQESLEQGDKKQMTKHLISFLMYFSISKLENIITYIVSFNNLLKLEHLKCSLLLFFNELLLETSQKYLNSILKLFKPFVTSPLLS